ncbi:MAG: hypothetical protein V4485_00540 [Pseudomonadota bacterium]
MKRAALSGLEEAGSNIEQASTELATTLVLSQNMEQDINTFVMGADADAA